MRQRLGGAIQCDQRETQVHLRIGVARIHSHRRLAVRQGLRRPAKAGEGITEVELRGRNRRFDPDLLLILGNSVSDAARLGQRDPEVGVRAGVFRPFGHGVAP